MYLIKRNIFLEIKYKIWKLLFWAKR